MLEYNYFAETYIMQQIYFSAGFDGMQFDHLVFWVYHAGDSLWYHGIYLAW